MPDKVDYIFADDIEAPADGESELKERIVSGNQAFKLLNNPDFNGLVNKWSEDKETLDRDISTITSRIANDFSLSMEEIGTMRLDLARMTGYRDSLIASYDEAESVVNSGEDASKLLRLKTVVDDI